MAYLAGLGARLGRLFDCTRVMASPNSDALDEDPRSSADPGFGLRLFNAGRTVGERLQQDNRLNGVYLSGAICAGLGTTESDIDLYVVADRSVLDSLVIRNRTGDTSASVIHVMEQGCIVDVSLRTPDHVERLARKFDRFRFTLQGCDQIQLDDRDLRDAIRLFLGEPIGSSLVVREARDCLDRDELRKLAIAHYAGRCLHLLRDVRGQTERSDDASVASLAHQALLFALEALAAGCDELFISGKWTWVKLRRCLDEETYARLEHTVFGSGDRSLADLADHWLAAAQLALTASFVDGWERPEAARWEGWARAESGGGIQDGPRRRREWLPFRTVDEVLLGTHDTVAEVSVDGLHLWGLCDGRPRSMLIDQMQRWLMARDDPPTRADIERYLDKLIAIGTVGD